MAKDNNKPSEGAKTMQYIGPDYKTGLLLPNGETIRPREWNKTKIKKMIRKYPNLQRYFN